MPRARTSTALVALAIVALAGAYGLGSRRAATETIVTARDTAAAPATTEATVAPQTTTAAPPAEVMDEAAFWRLVTDTRAAADDDTGRQSELLDERLRRLPAEQIAAFERIRHALDLRAYTRPEREPATSRSGRPPIRLSAGAVSR